MGDLPIENPSHGMRKKSEMNKFFDKIFIINLDDQKDRLEKITERLSEYNIEFSRFPAIDGRCNKDPVICNRKRLEFQKDYDVKIPKSMDLPPASLTLGTVLMLREMIKKKWKRIAILEDDATITNNINERLREGIKEIKEVAPNWDVLYLGCTQYCGSRGISREKTKENKYLTSINKFVKKANWYVEHKDDIRIPCDKDECVQLSKNISIATYPAGGFGYAISLKGARKILKIINNNINDHMDGILPENIGNGKLKAISFDPPIINHYGGADRPDTTLDWDWEI